MAKQAGTPVTNTISVNETVPVTLPNHPELNGNYTYLGHEPGLPGYVAQGPDGKFYLFSNQTVPDGQNFNIGPEDTPFGSLAGPLTPPPAGPTPVEYLAIGDQVVTADGRTVFVNWIGRQTTAVRFGIPEGRRPVVI